MQKSRRILLMAGLIWGFTSAALGDLQVINERTNTVVLNRSGSGPHSFSLSAPTSGTLPHQYRIQGDSNTSIGSVQVASIGAGETLELSILDASGIAVLQNCASISKTSPTGILDIKEVRLKGSLGSVTADVIGNISIEGSLNGLIAATNGRIGNITAEDGIFGNITSGGAIGALLTGTGSNFAADFGQDGSPINIYAKGGIGLIRANNVYGNIDADVTDGDADGSLYQVDIRGTLHGSIKAGSITNYILSIGVSPTFNSNEGGDLPAGSTITLGQPFGCPTGGCSSGTGGRWQLRIGNNFGGTINLPANGLTGGQISVNYNRGAGAWQSGGKVNIGSVVLDKEEYTALAAQVGSGWGSAGRIGYRVQGNTCVPAEYTTYANDSTVPTDFTLRFFGPVKWTTATPFKLQQRARCSTTSSCNGWIDTTYTGVDTLTTLSSSGGILRGTRDIDVQISSSYSFRNGFEYRIAPDRRCNTGGGLRGVFSDQSNVDCFGVDPSPCGGSGNIVAGDGLIFRVGNLCSYDFNGDGLVNGSDLSILLAQFDNSNTAGQAADANGDNICNGSDLSVLLAKFNTTCPTSCPTPPPEEGGEGEEGEGEGAEEGGEGESLMSGGPSFTGLDIVQAFGYSTIESYIAWVGTMNAAEFANHAEVLQAVVAALESDDGNEQ